MAGFRPRSRRPRPARYAALALLAGSATALDAQIAQAVPAAPTPATAAPAPPSAATPTAPAPSAPAADDASARVDSELGWRQALMAPRVTGNLRAVGIDPADARNVWVGTEEGTLVHSLDGGITWDEVQLSPFSTRSPTSGIVVNGDSYKAIDVFAGFWLAVSPHFIEPYSPMSRRSASIDVGFFGPALFGGSTSQPVSHSPFFLFPFRPTDPPKEPLLGAVASADAQPYNELSRIRVCPDAVYVATRTRLYGSVDGTSFGVLLTTRESSTINDIACPTTGAPEVVVATTDGTFRSVDVGTSFDPLPGDIGTSASSAATFLPPDKDGKSKLALASGSDLYIGDPTAADGLRAIATSSAGAPADINGIAASARSIWLATESGVRVSHDGGATWEGIEDLSGSSWEAVAAAPGATAGHEDVVVMRDDVAFASSDGASFQVSFRAQSRRRLRQVVVSAARGFFLVTSGELFTSAAPPGPAPGDENIRRQAAQRLRRLPSLASTLQAAMGKARLSDEHIDELERGYKERDWLPQLQLFANIGKDKIQSTSSTSLTGVSGTTNSNSQTIVHAHAYLVWELPELVSPTTSFAPIKKNLYELQKRLSFVVEDAYVERRALLGQLAGGGLDIEQLLTVTSRIDVLDVVLAQLTGVTESN